MRSLMSCAGLILIVELPLIAGCEVAEFGCSNGRCVYQHHRCDGHNDCWDNSDEQNCKCDPGTEFTCSNSRCIPRQRRCDSINDCWDRSDEQQCDKRSNTTTQKTTQSSTVATTTSSRGSSSTTHSSAVIPKTTPPTLSTTTTTESTAQQGRAIPRHNLTTTQLSTSQHIKTMSTVTFLQPTQNDSLSRSTNVMVTNNEQYVTDDSMDTMAVYIIVVVVVIVVVMVAVVSYLRCRRRSQTTSERGRLVPARENIETNQLQLSQQSILTHPLPVQPSTFPELEPGNHGAAGDDGEQGPTVPPEPADNHRVHTPSESRPPGSPPPLFHPGPSESPVPPRSPGPDESASAQDGTESSGTGSTISPGTVAQPSPGDIEGDRRPPTQHADEDHAAVLARWYNRVSVTLDVQSVASYMMNCHALNVRQLEQVTSKRSKPINAAGQLLDIVRKERYAVYVCFKDALSETGHEHVRTLIETGNSQDFDQQYVHAESIHQNYKYLLQKLDVTTSGLLNTLCAKAVIDHREKESISRQQTSHDQNQELLTVLLRKTKDHFENFLDALDSTGQHHVRIDIENN